MRALICLMFCGAMAAQTPCAMEGTVLNDATGEPLANVALKLRPSRGLFTTQTDEKGRYAFAGIESGQYTLSAERNGFVTANYGARRPLGGGKPLVLDPGRKASGVDFRLTPAGAIAGNVRKGDGDPLVYGDVVAMRQGYVNGRKELISSGNARTNDLGEYRIFGLASGRYYISAAPRSVAPGSMPEPLDTRPETVLKTYFPSTPDALRAEPVEVKAGQTTSGVNVTLAGVPTTRIRGRVEDIAAVAGNATFVGLTLVAPDGTTAASSTIDLKTGEFEARMASAPDRYWLRTSLQRGGAVVPGASQIVDTTGGPLAITWNSGAEMPGAVRVEAGGPPVNLRLLTVWLQPLDFPMANYRLLPNQPVSADGSFSITGIPPDRYLLNVAGLPNGVYLKSARIGEASALDTPLDLTTGAPGQVEIVVSGRTGTVQGSVKDATDAPAAGATVALVPQDPKRRERADWYRATTTDAAGKFTLTGLPPGEYKLFAWEDVEDTAWMDPEFLKPFEAKGNAVTVSEGVSQTVDLKAIQPE